MFAVRCWLIIAAIYLIDHGVGVDLAEIRRLNALAIMRENALDEMGFALCLGKEEAFMESVLALGTSKKINDALARLMEQTFSKPNLWLDHKEGRGQAGPSFDLFG